MGLRRRRGDPVRARDRQGRRSTWPANADTVRNIRIWDPSTACSARPSRSSSGIRDYYRINDVDVDRYELNGEPTQVVLSVRDLNTGERPRRRVGGRAPHLHPRLRRHRGARPTPRSRAASRASSPRTSRTSADAPSSSSTSPRSTSARTSAATSWSGSKQQELNFQDDEETQYDDLRGRRRRRARQPRQAGRLRPALRRRQPADLRPAHRRARRSSTSATSGAGRGAGAVPRTSTPTRTR